MRTANSLKRQQAESLRRATGANAGMPSHRGRTSQVTAPGVVTPEAGRMTDDSDGVQYFTIGVSAIEGPDKIP